MPAIKRNCVHFGIIIVFYIAANYAMTLRGNLEERLRENEEWKKISGIIWNHFFFLFFFCTFLVEGKGLDESVLKMIQVQNVLTDATIQIMSGLYFKSRFSRTVYKSFLGYTYKQRVVKGLRTKLASDYIVIFYNF